MSLQDTFYDPEDGSTRNLKLLLLTMDRSQVLATNWLQFDIKNQEFFGTPMKEDEGRKEYQLVSVLQILFLTVWNTSEILVNRVIFMIVTILHIYVLFGPCHRICGDP